MDRWLSGRGGRVRALRCVFSGDAISGSPVSQVAIGSSEGKRVLLDRWLLGQGKEGEEDADEVTSGGATQQRSALYPALQRHK